MTWFSLSIDDLLKDSDDEDELDVKAKAQKTGKKSRVAGKAWLHEGGDEDITDFMDVSAAKKVMGE